MTTSEVEIWSFVAEYYDPLPQLTKQYLLKYFPSQNQVEMFDLKNKKLFLKKSPCPPELTSEDFRLGAQILLFSRDLKIVDFADNVTKSLFLHQVEEAIIGFPTYLINNYGQIIDYLYKKEFNIIKFKSISFTNDVSICLSKTLNLNHDEIEPIPYEAANNIILFLKLQREDCFAELEMAISILSENFKTNHIIASHTTEQCKLLHNVIFEVTSSHSTINQSCLPNSAVYTNSTLCIIKPHVLKARFTGEIIDMIISKGFQISAFVSLNMTKAQAEEFLEIYKSKTSSSNYFFMIWLKFLENI
jgi:nucleoside-diphosphate kinase